MLADDLSRNDDDMVVTDASGFPAPGTAIVSQTVDGVTTTEVIGYQTVVSNDVDGQMLVGLTRGLEGTTAESFDAGARVTYIGPVEPSASLSGGGIVSSTSRPEDNTGRDGSMHLVFTPAIDPDTGLVVTDPETGAPLAVYRMDTDTGLVLDPNGNTFRTPPRQSVTPNVLDLLQLRIDSNTELRATGSRPLVVQVASEAQISGTINVSGENGGELVFDRDDLRSPESGVGGAAGAGGGPGGRGGTIEFRNGDVEDKDPENTVPASGGLGRLPEQFLGSPPQIALVPSPEAFQAQPGQTLRGQSCGTLANPRQCVNPAGGGGGGGSRGVGRGGEGVVQDDDGNTIEVGGGGGSSFGVDSLRFDGGFWLFGGMGGAGGGGNPHVSQDYQTGNAGDSLNPAAAAFAPGTGGGGGGGVLVLQARHLVLEDSARLLARGGDAFQSIDLGGNGGGGGGGNIILQLADTFSIARGAKIDVRGGAANVAVPNAPGLTLPRYEGNVRDGSTLVVGLGGDGAPGRVLIEALEGSRAAEASPNANLTAGPFLVGTFASVGVSRSRLIGVGDSGVVLSYAVNFRTPVIRYNQFGQPVGTASVVLWQGAPTSLDRFGAVGDLSPGTHDPSLLQDREYVRFAVWIFSNPATSSTQSLSSVALPYKLNLVPPLGN